MFQSDGYCPSSFSDVNTLSGSPRAGIKKRKLQDLPYLFQVSEKFFLNFVLDLGIRTEEQEAERDCKSH
jgi:hypothetical protein